MVDGAAAAASRASGERAEGELINKELLRELALRTERGEGTGTGNFSAKVLLPHVGSPRLELVLALGPSRG